MSDGQDDYEETSEEESLTEPSEQRDDTDDWKEQTEEGTEQHYWQYDMITKPTIRHTFMLTERQT
jgi:hypothetical protein